MHVVKNILKLAALSIATMFLSFSAQSIEVNQKAPAFNLIGEDGKGHALKDFAGKLIVLEWLNHGCPFVRKHYESGNMQKTQAFAKSKGVVWLSIISSAPGNQGYVDVAGALKNKLGNKSQATQVLLDPNGKVGKSYNAKTTPYMVIINKEGKIAYHGAIDSIASADQADVPKAKNYVTLALSSLLEGKDVSEAKTRSYGCGVKY